MTKRVGEFGRRWDARVPRSDIHFLVNKFHVGMADEAIEAEILRRIGDDARFTPSLRRQCVAFAIACHNANRDLFVKVTRGGF